MMTEMVIDPSNDRAGGFNRRRWWIVALIALLAFTCIAPTLSWMEFSNSMENLNAATALEIRRGGPIFVPTLEGVPRIEKPPLTAWITAAAIRGSNLAQLDASNDSQRDAAYRSLAFDIRWPALLASCMSLLAIYSIGETILGVQGGLMAALIAASNFFFLRFARNSTTDVQLMLWVTVAHAFLARAILKQLTWTTALGSGVAIGLAFMSKGPVALVQTILPAIAFIAWARTKRKHASQNDILFSESDDRTEGDTTVSIKERLPLSSTDEKSDVPFFLQPWSRTSCVPVLVAAAVAVASGLWWFLAVGIGNPRIIHRWLSETNPAGGERISGSSPLQYLVLLPFMLPWTAFLIDGGIRLFVEARRNSARAGYPLFLLIAPVLVMSCFHDRKDRYILPLLGIAAVVSSRGVQAMVNRERRSIPPIAHWITLLVMALLPLAGLSTRVVQSRAGTPWLSATFALVAAVIGVIIVASGFFVARRRPVAIVIASFALMMWLQCVGIRGYITSREGTSDMRPLADSIRHSLPDAEMFNYRQDGVQKRASVDLSIYLNRITRWVADPSAIAPDTSHQQVYLTLQNKGEPDPEPLAGWKYFDKVRRDKDFYWAFVRDR